MIKREKTRIVENSKDLKNCTKIRIIHSINLSYTYS